MSDSDVKEGVLFGVDGGVSFGVQIDGSDIDEPVDGTAEHSESKDSLTVHSSANGVPVLRNEGVKSKPCSPLLGIAGGCAA